MMPIAPYPFEEGELQAHQVDPCGYWIRHTSEKSEDGKRKLLRKQIFTGIVNVLHEVVQHHPQVIIGYGQGALIALLMSRPLVIEAAARARIVSAGELASFRRAWAGVVGLIGVDAQLLPKRTDFAEILAAMPEIAMPQPQGLLRVVLKSSIKGQNVRQRLDASLAKAIGTVAYEQDGFADGEPEIVDEFERVLALPIPFFSEDGPSCTGHCIVCGKRGASVGVGIVAT